MGLGLFEVALLKSFWVSLLSEMFAGILLRHTPPCIEFTDFTLGIYAREEFSL